MKKNFLCLLAEEYRRDDCYSPNTHSFLGMAAILEGGVNNKDGTSGNPFMSINLLNVDPVTKEGEVAVYTRNTFMGYIKVNLYFYT